MKQYLWVGLAVAFVSASASDNPFDLKENFGKLDQDQEVLLSELKKIAAKKALVEEKAEKTIVKEKQLKDESVQEGTEEVLPVLKPAVVESPIAEESSNTTEVMSKPIESTKNEVKDTFMKNTGEEKVKTVLTSVDEKNIESNKSIEIKKNEVKENEVLLQAIKEKESELKRAKEEARKIEEAKKEAERREVEAYEKQRAEKLARKLATDKAAKELIEAEKEVAQKELLKKEHSEENISVEVVKEKVSGIVDINLTQENEEAKKIADQAYEEAVSEMSQED